MGGFNACCHSFYLFGQHMQWPEKMRRHFVSERLIWLRLRFFIHEFTVFSGTYSTPYRLSDHLPTYLCDGLTPINKFCEKTYLFMRLSTGF